MSDDVLQLIVDAMPVLAAGLPLAAVVIGLARWTRAPAASRPQWRRAAWISGAAAACVAALAGVWLTAFFSDWAGEFQPLGLVLGAALGAGVFAASLGGYGLVAGRRPGGLTLAAVVVAPIAFIGGPLWIGDLAQTELHRRDLAAIAAETAARSAVLHVNVVSSDADLSADGSTVTEARIVIVVRTDAPVSLQRDPNIVYPVFTLSSAGASPAYMHTEGPPAGPFEYVPGRTIRYDLSFRWDGYGTAPPGGWNLELFLTRGDGQILRVSVPVRLGA